MAFWRLGYKAPKKANEGSRLDSLNSNFEFATVFSCQHSLQLMEKFSSPRTSIKTQSRILPVFHLVQVLPPLLVDAGKMQRTVSYTV